MHIRFLKIISMRGLISNLVISLIIWIVMMAPIFLQCLECEVSLRPGLSTLPLLIWGYFSTMQYSSLTLIMELPILITWTLRYPVLQIRRKKITKLSFLGIVIMHIAMLLEMVHLTRAVKFFQPILIKIPLFLVIHTKIISGIIITELSIKISHLQMDYTSTFMFPYKPQPPTLNL
jgi:hypothetical protein